jgi:hypothetical protein
MSEPENSTVAENHGSSEHGSYILRSVWAISQTMPISFSERQATDKIGHKKLIQ